MKHQIGTLDVASLEETLRHRIGMLLVFVLAFASWAHVLSCQSPVPTDEGRFPETPAPEVVERVVDGDTVRLEELGAVRLIGLDCPEPDECFGPEASAEALRVLPPGEAVRLESGPEDEDFFRRKLRYIHRLRDGHDVNLQLVAGGFCEAETRFPHPRMEAFVAVEESARDARLGLWAACAPEPQPVPEPEPEGCDGPPATRGPGCYVALERVPQITQDLLHGMTFGGWRDPITVADRYSWAATFFGFVSPDELRAFGVLGGELVREGEDRVLPQLRSANRRCDPDNRLHDPAFLRGDGSCGQSEMTKARLEDFRARVEPHQARASEMRDKAQRCAPSLSRAFDGIVGFCQVLVADGVGLEVCPR